MLMLELQRNVKRAILLDNYERQFQFIVKFTQPKSAK